MSVKIFLGSILVLVTVTITGFAYWFFPILDRFHQQMGGAPLKDPRGDWKEELNLLLSFLPDNNFARAVIVCSAIVGYFFLTTLAILLTKRLRMRREARIERRASRARTLNAYNARRS
jgi:hypothetical protein